MRMFYVVVAIGAYLIGSFPSGFLIGKLRGVDLRREGSGNIGATNALRVLGKKWGYLCFALDIGKGVLAVTLAKIFAPSLDLTVVYAAMLAAGAVLVGHTFPVWLGFKGGKGIATSGGIAIALFPPVVFFLSIGIWLAVFLALRIVSIASLAAAATLGGTLVVLAVIHRAETALAVVGVAMAALVFWLHRANISRLAQGTEPRFEKRRKS
jgi:acyl phosphate:glycerol-3-phosphate acyltransferase